MRQARGSREVRAKYESRAREIARLPLFARKTQKSTLVKPARTGIIFVMLGRVSKIIKINRSLGCRR